MASNNNNNETVHISLGNTANYVTSHLLNLQGLAATPSSGGGNSGNEAGAALCDPSVTHDISTLDSDYYSGGASSSSSSSSSRYMYVPRALIVDGRDSFGTSWGGVSRSNNNNDPNADNAAWNGAVSMFDASEHATICGDQRQGNNERGNEEDDSDQSLARFHHAASIMGLSPLHSRFNATQPSRSYNATGDSTGRHVQWDEEEEEEEEEEDDYCYGQNTERIQEEKRRQLEKMEYQTMEARRNWNAGMEDAFEEAFYGGGSSNDNDNAAPTQIADASAMSINSNSETEDAKQNATANATNSAANSVQRRDIQWYDYWMPPKPSPSKYQISLPFDTAASDSNTTNNAWSTSFNMGYHPASGGGGGMSAGLGGDDTAGITHSWREHVLSESLRKVLEGCDVVKGFNIFVDGGDGHCSGLGMGSSSNSSGTCGVNKHTIGGSNKHAKQLSEIMAGGGFHAGLATSLLEELSEECRSAGRWAVMVDPPRDGQNGADNTSDGTAQGSKNPVHHFRSCINAGLALHGLSSNSDAFLPVSVDGAHHALHSGGDEGNNKNNTTASSPNRILFEGSAAIALALEASTLFYRLRSGRQQQPNRYSSSSGGGGGGGHRSRIGIQSGFYQGYSGGDDSEFANEPYATAPSLTYHEFLACARPSSDRRRSILELDACLHPISYPSAGTAFTGTGGINNVAGALSSSVLASLTSSGLIGGGGSNNNAMGELQKRMERGTSIERMRMEQQQQQRSQYRSSRDASRRGGSSSRPNEPGEWLEDGSTKNAFGGGGLLSSFSGNSIPFGRRADHHHFAISTSLRPAASDNARSFNSIPGSGCTASAFLRPMMESMGVKYRPEVSLGMVAKDTVVDLTGVGSYWRAVFTDRQSSSASSPATAAAATASGGSGNLSVQQPQQQGQQGHNMSPRDIASHTPILSVLGNSTRSYPRLNSISTGFVDAVHSRRNTGFLSRDVMVGIVPEKDDCEEALEYCQELVDVYEPPMGSGLVGRGEDENDDFDAYFDENED
eukprot:CAMPEP_0172299482 /NCGR_PEP_ID=MMETSP1058-20130122/1772_1 /TAXON_ID=83371 /ORGANISM="Detonula confervacea, Strain CCMP 353" /LENGTH=1012 /DNA_ID=CAMNT_0013008939 /DNA_START=79 /DNA_END=3117 /DNA_ORIENTATION=+